MYNALLHAHSGLRWVALILLLAAIFNAARSQSSGQYVKKDKMLNLFAMVMLHIQLLIGLGLYFINAKSKITYASGWMGETMYRFYGLEHILGMLLAITVITLGRKKAEKLQNTRDKHRRIMISYLLGLVLILVSIPWPFRADLGGQWF
jgi:hypothetical protein